MHIWCLNWFPAPPANGCSEVMDIFSANHSDNCMIRVIGSRSEGSSSSHQMCSHVEIITCLLAVFILRHTDWIITYSSFAQRHYCDMQMLIVMDLVPWTKYYCCSYRISQCSQQSASWEDETEIARPHIHIYGSEHSVWQTWLFYPQGFELLINNHIALSANRNSCWPRYSGPFGPSTLYKQGVCRNNHKCTFYSSNYSMNSVGMNTAKVQMLTCSGGWRPNTHLFAIFTIELERHVPGCLLDGETNVWLIKISHANWGGQNHTAISLKAT